MNKTTEIPMTDCPDHNWSYTGIHQPCQGTGQIVDLNAVKLYIAGATKDCPDGVREGADSGKCFDCHVDCEGTGKVPLFPLRKPCSCANLASPPPTLCGYCSTRPVGTEGTWIAAHSKDCSHFCQGRTWLPDCDDLGKGMKAVATIDQEEGIEVSFDYRRSTRDWWVEIHPRKVNSTKWFYGEYEHPDPLTAFLCALMLAVKEMGE